MRYLICSVSLAALLGCSGTVEVESWDTGGGEDWYDSSDPAAVPQTDGPHMRLVGNGGATRAYFTVQLLQAGSLDGVYDGWCTNSSAAAPWGGVLPIELYGSTGTVPEGIVAQPENLDLLNYILNAYSVGDVVQVDVDHYGSPVFETIDELGLQDVVWALVDHAEPWWELPATLVEEAMAEGEGFVPGCGDIEVVLAVPLQNVDGDSSNDVQSVAVETPVVTAGCP